MKIWYNYTYKIKIKRYKVIKGKLIKGVGGKYTVVSEGKVYSCFARGKIKQDKAFKIGDNVEFFDENNSLYIERILPRKNSLVRPKIANIDQLVIILAPTPKPDFLLIDKLIIYGNQNNIKTLLCINKNDLADFDFIEDIKAQYEGVVNSVISVSATTYNGLDNLVEKLEDKLSVFAGQSAVGKSTILNALKPELNLATDVLSKKTDRGKHTTRHTEIFELPNNTFIADTPGFSLLDLFEVDPHKLHELYEDFNEYRGLCKYRACNHIQMKETECGVKRAVTEYKLHSKRYKRYLELYAQTKERWDKKYD